MYELRQLREAKGLKRDFVANKLNICPDHLNVIERGDSLASLTQIEVLSQLYNTPFGILAEMAFKAYKERSNTKC